jgi:hypothetical protein
MTEESLERSMTIFRGERSREVDREDFVEALSDLLGLGLIQDAATVDHEQETAVKIKFYERVANRLRGRSHYKQTIAIDSKVYATNAAFWTDSLSGRHREGQHIKLQGFHLTEWTPYSPGRYYTPQAAEARHRARSIVSWTNNEYLPLGKENMMLGGVGSIRLRGRTIDGRQYYFLGASSTGISHQGVPLIVPESEYSKVVNTMIDYGGCYAHVTGSLRVMPPELSLISFSNNVPKYFVLAQDIEPIAPSSANILLVTVAVMYSGSYYDHYQGHGESFELGEYSTKLRKSWTFCSFNPASGSQAITAAAEWLQHYAGRYTGNSRDPILSDFDEHYQHFDNPIEFPIRSIIDHQIDMQHLGIYGRHYSFQIIAKEINVDNIFSNISNSTIVNESQVRESFNKISSDRDEATAQALLRIADEIERSKNQVAGALFNTFNTELQKDNRNSIVLKTLWDGIVGQLPTISSMVGVVEKITALFD